MDSSSIKLNRSESARAVSREKAPAPLLEPGRVLAAEVVRRDGGNQYQLSIGRERLLIQSEKTLQVGDRLEVRVERDGTGLSLRAVEATAVSKSALVQYLRAHEGVDHEFGRAIKELMGTLDASATKNSAQANLLSTLRGRVIGGAIDGRVLSSLLAAGGSQLEASLFQLATSADGDRSVTKLVGDLASAFLHRLTPSASSAVAVQTRFGAIFENALRALLLRPAGELTGDTTRGNIKRFFMAYARELTAVLSKVEAKGAGEIRQRADLMVGLRSAASGKEGPGILEPLLRRLLGGGTEVREQLLSQLRTDLKGQLLAALTGESKSSEPSGGERESIERVLAAVEQEQARNVARSENNDSRQWTLAVQDGPGLATLKVFRREGESGGRAGENDSMRFSLGVEMSQLGPMRADLHIDRKTLTARVTVAEAHTAMLIRRDLSRLTALFGAGGKEVSIQVFEGSPTQASVEDLERDIRFLDENHLLDVSA